MQPMQQYSYPSPQWYEYPAAVDNQVDGSIGPSRVLTRRQRAALEHAPTRRGHPEPSYDNAMYITPHVSRPQTPTPEYPHEALSLNMPPQGVQPSPGYHPLTPSSSASPYSTYGFYSASHSRSNSISNTTNPRSASPALSTTSALTSVSSVDNSNSRSFALPPTPDSLVSRAKQKKHRLYNVDRKQICMYHKENPNARQEDIARLYGVERSTISKILKNKTKWLNVPEDENLRIAKHRPSKFPEIEQDMVKWLIHCRDTNVVLSDSMIRGKAKEIARGLGIQEDRFKASSGWIENFKHRHGVRAGVWTGDGKNVRAARALGLGPPLDQPDGLELQDAPDAGVRLLSPLDHGDGGGDVLAEDDDVDLDLGLDEPEEVRVQRIAATGSGDISRPSWLRNPAQPPPAPSLPPPQQQQPPPLAATGSGDTSRPSWLRNPAQPPPAPSLPPPQQQQPPPQQPHPSVPPTRQLPEHSPYNGAPVAPVYYDAPRSDVVSYDAPPPRPEDTHAPMYDGAPPNPQGERYDAPREPEPQPHVVYPATTAVPQYQSQTSPRDAAYSPDGVSYDHSAAPASTGLAEAEAALDTVIRFFDTSAAGAGLIRPDERSVLAALKCALFQAGAQGAGAAGGMVPHTHGHGQYDRSVYQQEAQ